MHARRSTLALVMMFSIQSALAASAMAGGIVYVDDDAAPGGDGSSWGNAYRFLQDALDDTGSEIRVAQGTYLPDRSEAAPGGTGDQESAFWLSTGRALRGGYAGLGTADPDARDVAMYVSRLSGDLAGDDGGDFVNMEENSWHVVRATAVNDTAVLDGFLISGGNAAGPPGDPHHHAAGGGLNLHLANLTVVDCTFSTNSAVGGGGAVAMFNCAPTFTSCDFVGNVADDAGVGTPGGAMLLVGSTASIDGCTFTGNSARNGGAIHIDPEAAATVVGCQFIDNVAHNGGACRLIDAAPTSFIDCLFQGNSVDYDIDGVAGFGGAVANGSSEASYEGCVFTGNSAVVGGGLSCGFSIITLVDCEFLENTAAWGGAIRTNQTPLQATGCLFQGNTATLDLDSTGGYGGAVNNIESDSNFVECQFVQNSAARRGGAFRNDFGSPEIERCDFIGNSATRGGAIASGADVGAGPSLEACTLRDNTASTLGGAMYTAIGTSKATNCLFSCNDSGSLGGAAYADAGCTTEVRNCTIVDNTAAAAGGGLCASGSGASSDVCNSILSGNSAPSGAQVSHLNGGGSIVTYSLVEDGWPGTGNLDGDPGFVSIDGTCTDNDYRLDAESNCVDAGNNLHVPAGVDTDLDGNVRIVNDTVDMGAYERQPVCQGDTDGNGAVDVLDLIAVIICWGTDGSDCNADINGDGIVDVLDLILVIVAWGECE